MAKDPAARGARESGEEASALEVDGAEETFVNIAQQGAVNVPEELFGSKVNSLQGEIYLTSHYYEAPDGTSDGLLPGDDEGYDRNREFMAEFLERFARDPAFEAALGGDRIAFDGATLPPTDRVLPPPSRAARRAARRSRRRPES
jgi:hypothetical protein